MTTRQVAAGTKKGLLRVCLVSAAQTPSSFLTPALRSGLPSPNTSVHSSNTSLTKGTNVARRLEELHTTGDTLQVSKILEKEMGQGRKRKGRQIL